MQHLKEKWLKLFNYYYILYGVVSLLVYVYFVLTEKTLFIASDNQFGTSFVTGSFALTLILFNLFALKYIKKYSMWIAYTVSFALFAFTNSFAAEIALRNGGNWQFFLANNFFLSISAVALGPFTAIGVMSIKVIIYAMTFGGGLKATPLGITGDGLLTVLQLVIPAGLLILLRNKFVADNSTQKQNYIERYFVTNEVVRLLTDSIGDGVMIIDQRGVVRSVNPTLLKLINQERKNVIDLNYRSVLNLKNTNNTDIDPAHEPVMQALQSKKAHTTELILVMHGKPEIFVDINVSVIVDPESNELYGAVIIVRDVSKKKKEENARSEFVSTASHEMRTPVAAIEGYIELALNEKVSTIDPKAREYLEKARTSTQHLGRLFQDLLVSAKAEDGRIVNRPEVIEIGEILEQLVEYFQKLAAQKGLQVEFIISSSDNKKKENLKVIKPLYYVLADPDRIKEVASNLIDNAIKYTPSGKVSVGLTGNNEVVQFFIKDTGIGMAAEDIPHLFQKFYRIDSTATRTTGGTGLGLFISKKIISLYNGRIWAESKKGEGSTFYINLPRLSSSQAESMRNHNQPQTANPAPQQANNSLT